MNDTAATPALRCSHFLPLSPGHAAICMERWKDLPWNAAVPLTNKDGRCECALRQRFLGEG